VAEHKTDLLDGLCARMIVINDGQIVRDGPTADVLADPMLVELGVEPPARVRLQRALADAGLDTTVGLEREKLEGVVLEEARAAAAILPPALEGDR
jgi:energy-coupling factor transporter ATP-binding protein EcfA2